jgi:hypothetical protein
MAGSYGHVTDNGGKLLDPRGVNDMLENGGDVFEAVEEMYGMIWWLATRLSEQAGAWSAESWVEDARESYRQGIRESPGQAE